MRDVLRMNMPDRTTRVNVKELRQTLHKNREKHKREYEEAIVGYKELAKERLEKLRTKAESSLVENFKKVQEKIDKVELDADDEDTDRLGDVVVLLTSMTFNLKVPQNHTHAYDVAIKMAEWEKREEIDLSLSEFQCFILDEWDWQQEFQYLNKFYTAAARK